METTQCVLVKETKEKDNEEDEKELALDMEVLRDGFTPGPEGEVPLMPYVNAYSEMNKFFKLVGPLFHFVEHDISTKVALLRAELQGESSQYYVDVRKMLEYEVEHGLVDRPSPRSGTKTFLQLHRSLEYVSEFMEELLVEEEEPSLGQVSSQLYLSTMGRFHPPILSRPISVMLLLLPTRFTIRSRLSKAKKEAEETLKSILPEVIKSVRETYTASQKLYQDLSLLDTVRTSGQAGGVRGELVS